jgi:hypothetical protein
MKSHRRVQRGIYALWDGSSDAHRDDIEALGEHEKVVRADGDEAAPRSAP